MRKWIVTFGGAGLLPAMPGTFASIAALVIFYLIHVFQPAHDRAVILILSALVLLTGFFLAKWAQDYFHRGDPRQFVLDEVAGQWLTLLLVTYQECAPAYMVMGLFLFRTFDVAKPFPVNRVERLPGGWGIMLDDVVAAIYAGIVFWVLLIMVQLVTGQAVPWQG